MIKSLPGWRCCQKATAKECRDWWENLEPFSYGPDKCLKSARLAERA
jgi:hypothetical protein